MNNRLREIIQYKTGGKQVEFCRILGWTPQYLTKILKGVNFGLQPVTAILEAFPEIDARWFLFGTGSMITEKQTKIAQTLLKKVQDVLELEQYMPVMTSEELKDYEQVIIGVKEPVFSPDIVTKWKQRLNERKIMTEARFSSLKNIEVCRQKTVRK